jgi:hypothetical protein
LGDTSYDPTVVVENITGAGGLIQTNDYGDQAGWLNRLFNGGLILGQMMSQPGYDLTPEVYL